MKGDKESKFWDGCISLHMHIYIYVFVCVCMCVCTCLRRPDLTKSLIMYIAMPGKEPNQETESALYTCIATLDQVTLYTIAAYMLTSHNQSW